MVANNFKTIIIHDRPDKRLSHLQKTAQKQARKESLQHMTGEDRQVGKVTECQFRTWHSATPFQLENIENMTDEQLDELERSITGEQDTAYESDEKEADEQGESDEQEEEVSSARIG